MRSDNRWNQDMGEQSYTALFGELAAAVTDLVRNELVLIKEETRETGARLARHTMKAALFAGLLALSALPFLAFLVIGLGDLLEGRYWLSSLIVAVVFAGTGAFYFLRTFREIKENDLELPHVKNSLEQEKERINRKLNEVKEATHRRAV